MLVIILARQKEGFGISSVFGLVGGFVLLLVAKVIKKYKKLIHNDWIPDQVGDDTPSPRLRSAGNTTKLDC